jgi:2-polyprenyl-3-methyl-5-hydroxy-6-metoxy-1,4-benzoquinol methylase
MVEMHKPLGAKYSVQRRVRGYHDLRMDGMHDLVMRAKGKSVFDIGCYRGLAGYDFAVNGAAKVHGCDIYEAGILTAREWFADLRSVEAQFEVCDLTKGPPALKRFNGNSYDITLCLATYHKLKRVMEPADLTELVKHFGRWTKAYFAWRGTSEKANENDKEIAALDRDLGAVGLARIHTSYISDELGVAAIWKKV